jgi:putative oxidoreductase
MKTQQQAGKYFGQLLSAKAWANDAGLLILRLSCALMALHGWDKFSNFYDGIADWPDPLNVGTISSKGLTVFAELFCTLFVALGLFTRYALIPLIVCMLVIVFDIHAGDALGDREHGLLYLLSYLTLMLSGPGKYSLDWLIRKS